MVGEFVDESDEEHRAFKILESFNAMISLFWWMLGFYCIVVGGQALLQDAPQLYCFLLFLRRYYLVFTVPAPLLFGVYCSYAVTVRRLSCAFHAAPPQIRHGTELFGLQDQTRS
ncbi:hypothetical protein Cni_G15520 [Canna indica]|uniref:Uncharacterized protein n=1 Tax=Canna indica TaxID=4628 RepID=A0AAQ3QBN5_9LILI|nr:hypothetical protein Cni_G15520 [Canna indica]